MALPAEQRALTGLQKRNLRRCLVLFFVFELLEVTMLESQSWKLQETCARDPGRLFDSLHCGKMTVANESASTQI
jgi:hypothetical protein